MNCKKYLSKALYQKHTWLKQIPPQLKYYHVIGEENMDALFMIDEGEHILWVKVADDYNSLPKKVMLAYEAIYKSFHCSYIYKTDDDQILVNPHFFSILKNILDREAYDYGGYIVDVKQDYLSQYYRIHPELPRDLILHKTRYCSGRFYLLSRAALQDLLTKKYKIFREYLEDYAIGYYLDEKYKTKILMLQTNKYFTDIELSDYPEWVKKR
jgi:hypothetical protein